MAKKLKKLISDTEAFLKEYDEVSASGGTVDQSRLSGLLSYLNRWLLYFQHERLIHLIVTVLFGLCEIIIFSLFVLIERWYILPLLLLFTVLLVPYIFHYFTLENGVQKLYDLADALEKRKER
ncbi:MAG: hypothetical protein J5379_07495 [Clostridiales bacterium]|nr:hypothetical protein [Clostridiales bacterium]